MRTVNCSKLGEELEGLDFAPIPGDLGQKVFDNISKKAWGLWLEHQTILINEYRLNLMDAEARGFLMTELEKFLFGEGSQKPKEFKSV